MNKESDQYLGYLDKEMSIMGVLSAFCVAVPSLVLERLVSAAKESELASIWSHGEMYFWIASVLMLVASALFYKQRSLLAFYYGRIVLGKPVDGPSVPDLKGWEDWADSWTTWIPYNAGFWTGLAAGVEYVLAFLSHTCSSIRQSVCSPYAWAPILALLVLLGVMVYFHWDRPIRYWGNPWIEGWNRRREKRKVE
jgi:zinc transporter ZupT